jgi:PAB-dependent poly(A)-specific ribonuclease subunit 2
MVVDPFVKVYDIRMMRPLLPVAFPNGPALLRFHPKLSATAIVTSQSGLFQVIDISVTSGGTDIFQTDTMGNFITCMDLSGSGDVLAFGDSAGIVHEWIYKTDAHVNPFSRPSEWGTLPEPPSVKVSDDE